MSIYLCMALSFLNQTCTRAARVVLALYALKLGAQPLTIGVLAATFSVFPMVLAVPAGKLADRFGSRWLLIIGAIGGGLGMLVPFFFASLLTIFMAAAFLGACSTVYSVSTQNLVGLISTEDDRARNFSNYSLMASLSNFVGPIIAGFSIDHLGDSNACLTVSLLALAPITLLAARGSDVPTGRHEKARASGGLLQMLGQPEVRKTLVTSSMLHSGSDLFQFYLPIYGHDAGLSASAIGIILAMNAAAAFVVRSILPKLIARFKEERVLTYAFVMGAIAVALIPLFKNGVVLGVIAFTFGLGMGCGQPIVTMLMFGGAPKGRSGEALGLRMTVNHVTRVVSPVILGSIGSAFGLPSVFWVTAVTLAGGGAMSYPSSKGASAG